MARGHTSPRVEFAPTVKTLRPPHDDELIVMEHFAQHAKRCTHCADPYQAHLKGRQLCERGHAYALDVVTYIYSKGGKPFSVIDKHQYDQRNEIEVPAKCEPVRGLIKAIDRGLTLRRREYKQKPVISQDPVYPVQERREPRREHHDSHYVSPTEPHIVTITPNSARQERREREKYPERLERRRSTYGKGSLYDRDEEEKKQRQRYEQEPVIIYAEPKKRSVVYKR